MPTTQPSPRSRRRVPVFTAGLAAAVIAGAAGLALSAGAGEGADPKSPATGRVAATGQSRSMDLFEVARADFEITTTATGDLRARKQVDVRNAVEQESTITEIIPEGTFVKKGDVLVRLNAESTQQRLDEESLDLETARAAVVEAEQGYEIQVSENESASRSGALKLALARLSYEQWLRGDVQSKQQELRHAVDSAEKDEDRLRDKLDKSRDLFTAGYYSKDQLQQDELEFERAEAALEKASMAHDIYWEYEYPKEQKQKLSDVEEAEAEVERVARQNTSRIVSKEADRKNRTQVLAIREQKFDKLKEQLEAATIKAPSDGLVVYSSSIESSRWGDESGPLQVGSKVYMNQNIIALPDTSEMIASVRVHESLAGRLRKGQPCTIKIDALGDHRFTGRIDSVGILAEQTSRWMDPTLREYTVKIAIDTPPPASGTPAQELRPSMRCEAEITLGKVGDAVTVPIQAVYSEGLLRYVHVAGGQGAKYARRPVLVGQRSDRFAEIKVGLEPGEQVLLRKPDPAEVQGKGGGGWNPTELAAVGLEINAAGDILPTASAMAVRQERGGRGRGKPGGAEAGAVIPVASIPETEAGAEAAPTVAPAETTELTPESAAAPAK